MCIVMCNAVDIHAPPAELRKYLFVEDAATP